VQDIRIDDEGNQRCWNCGGKNFTEKRTLRSKVAVGTATVLTGGVALVGLAAVHKKLKCQNCGEYNQTGDAKPYEGPADRKWWKRYEDEQAAKHQGTETASVAIPTVAPSPVVASAPVASVAEELKKWADLRDAGVLTEEEFADQKAILLGHGRPTSAPAVPPPSENTMPSG
jgi:hypothetical protein